MINPGFMEQIVKNFDSRFSVAITGVRGRWVVVMFDRDRGLLTVGADTLAEAMEGLRVRWDEWYVANRPTPYTPPLSPEPVEASDG